MCGEESRPAEYSTSDRITKLDPIDLLGQRKVAAETYDDTPGRWALKGGMEGFEDRGNTMHEVKG